MYTPAEPPVRHRPRLYRYDPNSWYYKSRGYYPYYGSGYWVPRAEMRYRYRYVYRGPQYRYYPAWGYGAPPAATAAAVVTATQFRASRSQFAARSAQDLNVP